MAQLAAQCSVTFSAYPALSNRMLHLTRRQTQKIVSKMSSEGESAAYVSDHKVLDQMLVPLLPMVALVYVYWPVTTSREHNKPVLSIVEFCARSKPAHSSGVSYRTLSICTASVRTAPVKLDGNMTPAPQMFSTSMVLKAHSSHRAGNQVWKRLISSHMRLLQKLRKLQQASMSYTGHELLLNSCALLLPDSMLSNKHSPRDRA